MYSSGKFVLLSGIVLFFVFLRRNEDCLILIRASKTGMIVLCVTRTDRQTVSDPLLLWKNMLPAGGSVVTISPTAYSVILNSVQILGTEIISSNNKKGSVCKCE